MTSLGMFSGGWGWAVPLALLTLVATIGAVAERAGVTDGQLAVQHVLAVTLTFDHAAVDGAPAARFVDTLRDLVESAAVLDRQPAP